MKRIIQRILEKPVICEGVFSANIKEEFSRIAIFASFNKKHKIDETVIYYLSELKKAVDAIFFIADNPIYKKELEKIKDLVYYYRFNPHGEYDFGSYKIGFLYAKENGFFKNKQFVFCNDSCIGPFRPFSEFFNKMPNDCDFYGLTANRRGIARINVRRCFIFNRIKYIGTYDKHIQSYFFVISQKVFSSTYFIEFLTSVKHQKTKEDIIINYEIGLSRLLHQHGIKLESFFDGKTKADITFSLPGQMILDGFLLKRNSFEGKEINGYLHEVSFPFYLRLKKYEKRHKVAVCYHANNFDCWGNLLIELSRYNCQFFCDYFVVVANNDADIVNKIMLINPYVNIIPNTECFWNRIDPNNYDYIFFSDGNKRISFHLLIWAIIKNIDIIAFPQIFFEKRKKAAWALINTFFWMKNKDYCRASINSVSYSLFGKSVKVYLSAILIKKKLLGISLYKWLLLILLSLSLKEINNSFSKSTKVSASASTEQLKKARLFPESKLAHKYLDGLRGLEIGGSAHNPFGLKTLNIEDCYKKEESKFNCEPLKVDLIASADVLPFKDNSVDFVINSHVLEHFWDPIKAIKEWMRVIKKGGFLFMIIPHKDRTFDKDKEVTTLRELIDRHTNVIQNPTPDFHGHQSFWRTKDVLELCDYMKINVVEYQDVDDKVGNGFTIVIRK
ncbi:MAG: methyltransferase domain-containing protein [Bacteroidales bacterium]|jgi:SAM-dependent methyltransferase|nr:methyltransferase domain-containing protein [Bacteroidales bacterium]